LELGDKEIPTEFWWGIFLQDVLFRCAFYRLILAPSFFLKGGGGTAEYHKRLSMCMERFDCVMENTDWQHLVLGVLLNH